MSGQMLAAQSVLGVVLIPLFVWAISENKQDLGVWGGLKVIAVGLIDRISKSTTAQR